MKFKDVEIENLDLQKTDDVFRLIVEYLCGEKYHPPLNRDRNMQSLLKHLINNARHEGLNYEQFNELLLLLNQDRVSKPFFNFLFDADARDKIQLEDLSRGITKFRGFAMLCFGNFRFAYKQLIPKSEDELKEDMLAPYCRESSELTSELTSRPQKMLDIDLIEREKTWYLGHISGAKINQEAELLDEEFEKARKRESVFKESELEKFNNQLIRMKNEAKMAEKTALRNTDIYLTWDYMDIYVATSMRNRWEFEETFDFIKNVFNDSRLNDLGLRVFDPTQSKCKNSRDKGLIEGLMLKRALCTIYLAQESDTMGKDSELAATLAQSKPVIAYVPQYKPSEYTAKIKRYPLDFFEKRLLILKAEEVFSDPELKAEIVDRFPDFETKVDGFLRELDNYRSKQPFSLWFEKDTEFKKKYKDFAALCEILAMAECYNFNRRADLLKGRHPLSMQVDLQSGVANGVLVVRNTDQSVRLLRRILTNSIEFTISHQDEGFTVLEEDISSSPFRVVTDYERLTNSFWNFWRAIEAKEGG